MGLKEKYRPESFDDVVGQPVDEVKALLDSSDPPNFLFHGPPATGKTTTARIGAEYVAGDRATVFNASDTRGLADATGSITAASRTDMGGGRPAIVLDEADGMTTEAYEALRGPMENEPAVFFLTANTVMRFPDAILSRVYRRGLEFERLTITDIASRVGDVASEEGIHLSFSEVEQIAEMSNGDIREALDLLQAYEATGGSVLE
jgi:DNA polymerase III delta prime subunit